MQFLRMPRQPICFDMRKFLHGELYNHLDQIAMKFLSNVNNEWTFVNETGASVVVFGFYRVPGMLFEMAIATKLNSIRNCT